MAASTWLDFDQVGALRMMRCGGQLPRLIKAVLEFGWQVNYFLATHRAAQCCHRAAGSWSKARSLTLLSRGSEALVQSAETIFKSLAHRQSGRLEAKPSRRATGTRTTRTWT